MTVCTHIVLDKASNLVLKSDGLQWIVSEERTRERGKKKGEVYDVNPKYFRRLSSVFKYLLERSLMESGASTLDDLRIALDMAQTRLTHILDSVGL